MIVLFNGDIYLFIYFAFNVCNTKHLTQIKSFLVFNRREEFSTNPGPKQTFDTDTTMGHRILIKLIESTLSNKMS